MFGPRSAPWFLGPDEPNALAETESEDDEDDEEEQVDNHDEHDEQVEEIIKTF